MKKNVLPYILFSFVLLSACRLNYRPLEINTDLGLLVVDGFLSNSEDIRLRGAVNQKPAFWP